MKFRREELIRFYDEPKTESGFIKNRENRGSNVSAITGLIGEDLIIGLLQHYWRRKKQPSKVVNYKCNQGQKKGKRLDAWVLHNNSTLFQVEIKNWSGHSLNGYNLELEATPDKIKKFASKKWNDYFDKKLPPEIEKVIIDMSKSKPEGFKKFKTKKMICFWFYITDHYGKPYSIAQNGNEKLHIFSASAYLRSIDDKIVNLDMPRTNERFSRLKKLIVFDDLIK